MTPLWANSTTVRRPLGKMKPKDWFRQFLFYFYFYFILFYFIFDSSCEEQDIWLHGYKIPSSDPTSGQQYNRQATLGQNEAEGLVKTIFSFYIIFGLKLQGTRHLAIMVIKTLQWSHFEPTVQRLGRPLDKLRPKDWFRHLSTSTCKQREKWL